MLEVIRYALFCTLLEAVEGRLCSLEVLEMPGVIRYALLCMLLEAVEGRLCSLRRWRCRWCWWCRR